MLPSKLVQLLSEGQAGKVLETSNKVMSFPIIEIVKQQSTWNSLSARGSTNAFQFVSLDLIRIS
jgi:hypothetical protein